MIDWMVYDIKKVAKSKIHGEDLYPGHSIVLLFVVNMLILICKEIIELSDRIDGVNEDIGGRIE